jgi:hypothetical protein
VDRGRRDVAVGHDDSVDADGQDRGGDERGGEDEAWRG